MSNNALYLALAVLLSIVIIILYGCSPKYGPVRSISDYNAPIHSDYADVVPYNNFEADVLGPIQND